MVKKFDFLNSIKVIVSPWDKGFTCGILLDSRNKMSDEQYELCSNAFAMGKITEQEYKIQKSFFVYINMREQRIRGCSRAAFIRACKKFIDQEESRKVKMLLNEEDFDGNNTYKTKNDAIVKLISDKLRYHEDGMVGPM